MAKIPYVGLNSPFGNRGPDRTTPMNADTRGIGSGLAAAAGAVAEIGGSVVSMMEKQAEEDQRKADALAAAEAQVELQRRTNATNAALMDWTDRASRPGYNLETAEDDLRASLDGIEKREIPGLSPDRKVIYDGAIQNMDSDALAKAGQYRKTVYANRAEAAFAAGTDLLGSRATNLDEDIGALYKNADAMGEAASANLPVDTVQLKVRSAKEAISAGRIGTVLAGAQTIEALNALEQDIGGDKYVLDGTKKASYLSAIANKRNALQNKLENDRAARDRTAERAANKLQSFATSGLPPRPEDVDALLKAAQGTEFEGEARQAAAMVDLNKEFYTMPIGQAEAVLAKGEKDARYAPGGNKDPAFIKSALDAAGKIVAERKALATKFPIEALAADSGITFDPPAYDNPDKLAVQIRQRMDAVDAYRKRQGIAGIPDNPFSEAEQAQFADIITKAPSDQIRIGVLSAMVKAVDTPAEFRAVTGVLKQNSPLNYAVGELIGMAKAGGERIAGYIYQGEKVLAGKAMPLPSNNAFKAVYAEKMGAAVDPTSEEYANGFQRFTRLYASRATAEMGADALDDTTAEWAFSLATGGVADTDFGKVVKPYGMRTVELEEKLPAAIQQAAKSGGIQFDDIGDFKIEQRPGYNGQYYLVGPDSIIEYQMDANGKPRRDKAGNPIPIIVKVK